MAIFFAALQSNDKTARIWNPAGTANAIAVLAGHENVVCAVTTVGRNRRF